jgi:hypothetical protein
LASNGASTAYEAAVAAAVTQAEKDRLRDLRLRFNAPPDSPEWQFYAVLAPLLTAGSHDELGARLERIEALLRRNGKPATEPVVSQPVRVLMVVAATIAVCVGVVVLFGLGEATFARVLAAFALGASSTLGYVALAPRIGRGR